MKKPHQIQCYILITSINSESLTTRAGYFFYNFQELTTNMKQYDQTITIQQEREITLREKSVNKNFELFSITNDLKMFYFLSHVRAHKTLIDNTG